MWCGTGRDFGYSILKYKTSYYDYFLVVFLITINSLIRRQLRSCLLWVDNVPKLENRLLDSRKAWEAIYGGEKVKKEKRESLRKPEIYFTGFNYEERENLEADEVKKGLKVTKV